MIFVFSLSLFVYQRIFMQNRRGNCHERPLDSVRKKKFHGFFKAGSYWYESKKIKIRNVFIERELQITKAALVHSIK